MSKSTALVLFDIDGTLMRGAGQHHKQALIDGIQRVAGVTTTLDGISTAGTLDRDLIVCMLRAAGCSARQAHNALQAIMAECQNAYLRACPMDLSPFVCGGVLTFVAELKNRGAVLGLVTGNLSRIGWKKVELAGLGQYFTVGAFAEDGRTRARLARVCAQRAKAQGLVKTDCRITLIGDHPNDVEAAKLNGFQSVAVATGITPLEELRNAAPDHLVETLADFPVKRIFPNG